MSIEKLKKSALTSKFRRNLVYSIVGITIFISGFFVNATIFRYDFSFNKLTSVSERPSLEQLWEVYDLLNQRYDGAVDKDKFIEGAIKGAVASLDDPYTVYLNEAEAKELRDELGDKISGIGIEIGFKKERLTVIAPIDDTPAARAGLRAGDIIAQIDGADSTDYTIDEAVSKIRGAKGTTVKLMVVRANEAKEYSIIRDEISIKSVKSEIKTDGVGYIKISKFGDKTTAELKGAIKNLKSQNIKSVIIDLRNNPGGYLQTAVEVVSQFQNSGTIVTEKGKEDSANQTFSAKGNAILSDVPIVILVNNGTASASEITAGALHDNVGAVLIGEKTYGKGVVQDIEDLGGSRQLKVTIARWYTPKGINISKEGLSPDIEVKMSSEDEDVGRDPQLERALTEAQKHL